MQPPTHTLFQPQARTPQAPKTGDMVAFATDDGWIKVLLTGHSGHKHFLRDSLYWNILDGSTGQTFGAYLHQDELWGVLRGPERDIELSSTILLTPDQVVVYTPPDE